MARIILVDDDGVSSAVLTDILFAAGHAVGRVDDGNRALMVMRARPPHLAILGGAMPGLSGLALLDAMRRDASLAAIPVAILTANPTVRDERYAFRAGADDVLHKPIDAATVLDRIDTLLASGHPLRAVG